MFLTKMIDGRYYAHIQACQGDISARTRTVIDTGCKRSHLSYTVLQKLGDISYTGVTVDKGGVINGVKRPFNEAIFDIKFGGIVLQQQKILVAQSDDVTVSLLGVDILTKLSIRQIDNSYVLALNPPKPITSTVHITNVNLDEALHEILWSKARIDDFNYVKSILPGFIDMQYVELQMQVETILRNMSIKTDKKEKRNGKLL